MSHNLPGSEDSVTSWKGLMEALHSRNLVHPRPDEGDHLRSPYVFRGVNVFDWTLRTSLQRVPRNANASTGIIEHSLIRSFRKYANAGAFDDKSEWYVLAVAQHNGFRPDVWTGPIHHSSRPTSPVAMSATRTSTVRSGAFTPESSEASMNRILRSQPASGGSPGFMIRAC